MGRCACRVDCTIRYRCGQRLCQVMPVKALFVGPLQFKKCGDQGQDQQPADDCLQETPNGIRGKDVWPVDRVLHAFR